MANVNVKGLDEIVNMTMELKTEMNGLIKRGVFDGAKVLADSLHDEVEKLDTCGVPYFKEEVQGLIDSVGISKMETKNGKTSVSIGFSGYNSIKTKKYPNGQPNVLVARSINSGASYMPQNKFVKKAVNKSKQVASEKTVNTIKQGIENIQKKG